MNKQSSLTSFFKKAPSSDSVTKSNNPPPQKHEQLDIVEPASSQENQTLSTNSSVNPTQAAGDPNQSLMSVEDDDINVQSKKLYKRLKKNLRIDDDEEDFVPPPKESPPKKAASSRKGTSRKARNDYDDEDDDEEFETPKKSRSNAKNAKKKKVSDDDDDFIAPESPPEVESKKKSVAKGTKSQKKEKTAGVTPAKDAPQDELIDIGKNEGNAFDYKDFEDSTPEWAKNENARDANRKKPEDPGYDPTTLYVPPEVLAGKELTPTMKQYWQIKSQNYDKIVLFKLGKFYELFYEDALVCHRELDLNWMGNKMHVGFPEKVLEKYGYQLVSKGYKVCVVEQTETPKQMEERVKNQKSGKKEKLIRRETVQVMSKGTYVDLTNTDAEPKVLLSLRHRNGTFSVCFIEMGANIISVGSFKDDENYTLFKTFISQIRPVEVIYETIETNPTLLKIIRSCPTDPVMSPLNDPKAWNSIQGYAQLETYYGGAKESWPETLQTITKLEGSQKDPIVSTMAGLITYLTKMLIADNVMQTARYELYDPATFKLSRMVLDSQALQHLEILEVGYSCKNPIEGSLLGYIDQTVSPFGKRLMKKWICAPLLDVNAINDRLDAVEDLESLYELRNKFRVELKALPDLERACARIYNQGVKKKETVVMFEDVAGSRLRDFKKVLESLRKARNIINTFAGTSVKSNLLTKLTTLEDYKLIMDKTSQNMPDILPLLDEMAKFVVWEGPKQENPAPAKGVDRDYENSKAEIKKIEGEFDDYLKTIKAKLGSQDIYYAHAKHRYEIELPAKLVAGNKKPKDFEFSSKRADRERFVTSHIKELVEKLEEAEERLKATLNVFVCFLFNFFHKHYPVWDRFIEGLAQLDCLCSLSVVSFVADGAMCRPEVYPPNEKVFLDVRNMRHPCVSVNKKNFVSNDIILGDIQDVEHNKNVMILTGPNMGGKSTILRQSCIAAIIAQLGCYVPASSCKLSVVDRVFTRIGASDRLSEGKSTFYIEMEETVNVMKYGTMNSLAIMDELGRGTSTFDGVAIAYSVMNYIVNKLGCRTLFATHYHVLLDEFRENAHMKFFHMASKIDNDNERVIFLYKLIQGECSNSFGLNIARISGMDPHVVKVAKEKADEFEKNLNIREAVKTSKAFGKITKALGHILNEDEDIEANFEAISNALEIFSASS